MNQHNRTYGLNVVRGTVGVSAVELVESVFWTVKSLKARAVNAACTRVWDASEPNCTQAMNRINLISFGHIASPASKRSWYSEITRRPRFQQLDILTAMYSCRRHGHYISVVYGRLVNFERESGVLSHAASGWCCCVATGQPQKQSFWKIARGIVRLNARFTTEVRPLVCTKMHKIQIDPQISTGLYILRNGRLPFTYIVIWPVLCDLLHRPEFPLFLVKRLKVHFETITNGWHSYFANTNGNT